MDEQQEGVKELKINPMKNANIFSLLFFRWMNDTLKVGSKRPLQDGDLYSIQDEFTTETLVKKLELEWNRECDSCARKNGRQPRLWKVMFRMFSFKNYFLLCGVKFTHSAASILLPVLVWLFLMSLSENSAIDHYSTLKYVGCICAVSLVKGISQHHSFFLSGICGMQMASSVIGLIYKKVRLSCHFVLNT